MTGRILVSRSAQSAAEFRSAYNGLQYNSLEPDICSGTAWLIPKLSLIYSIDFFFCPYVWDIWEAIYLASIVLCLLWETLATFYRKHSFIPRLRISEVTPMLIFPDFSSNEYYYTWNAYYHICCMVLTKLLDSVARVVGGGLQRVRVRDQPRDMYRAALLHHMSG